MTAGAALVDLPTPRIAVGEPANFCLVDLDAEWEVGEPATRAARRTAASRAGRCAARARHGRGAARSPTASARSPSWARGVSASLDARARARCVVVSTSRRRFRAVRGLRRRSAAACGRSSRARASLGVPVRRRPRSTRRGSGRSCPRSGLGEDVEPRREDGLLGRARRRLRPRRARPGDRVRDRDARLRLPDGARPARARRRGARRRRRGRLAPPRRPASVGLAQDGARRAR